MCVHVRISLRRGDLSSGSAVRAGSEAEVCVEPSWGQIGRTKAMCVVSGNLEFIPLLLIVATRPNCSQESQKNQRRPQSRPLPPPSAHRPAALRVSASLAALGCTSVPPTHRPPLEPIRGNCLLLRLQSLSRHIPRQFGLCGLIRDQAAFLGLRFLVAIEPEGAGIEIRGQPIQFEPLAAPRSCPTAVWFFRDGVLAAWHAAAPSHKQSCGVRHPYPLGVFAGSRWPRF